MASTRNAPCLSELLFYSLILQLMHADNRCMSGVNAVSMGTVFKEGQHKSINV